MVLYQYDNHADILHTNLKGTLAWLLHERPRSPKEQEVELLTFIEKECMAVAAVKAVEEDKVDDVVVENEADTTPSSPTNNTTAEKDDTPAPLHTHYYVDVMMS
eukprot:GFYU01032270.1.p1 GENE.GFYU01032270.1~~GFYU01032270.1.p1  ORF type:complete len:104 (-),score=25.10 GFYU01032270.1:75-386(-)